MKAVSTPGLIDQEGDDAPTGTGPVWVYVLCVAMMIGLFITDIILPGGATEAIGYCLVVLVAAEARRRGFLFGIAITCTVLIWIAFCVEPPRHSAWRPAFDRIMITGVIWFAFFLVLRRVSIIRTLISQTQELKETTAELARSNGELANFASVVAHDLRGPLNTIGLFARLLSGSASNRADVEQSEWASSIEVETSHMGRFIQGLLTYGRVGAGEVKVQPCDCTEVLRDVQRNLKASIETNHVNISGDSLPVVHADPILMEQLFQNLIENSIKYRGNAPPHIQVSAVQLSDSWRFSVTDNGMGIRPEDCERIFKPFCQTDAGKSVGNGVGLGLATCKRIVERHGGHIRAQSTLGEGTTILFTIPGELVATKPVLPWPLKETRPVAPERASANKSPERRAS